MALTVEDGTGKKDSNSYLSVSEADTIANDLLIDPTEWTNLSTSDKELYLRRATRELDQKANWVSEIKDPDTPQALAWPREEFKDNAGRTIANDIVPQLVKEATLFLANNQAQNGSTYSSNTPVKSESYGDTSVEYAAADAPTSGEADFFLKALRSNGYASSSNIITVFRS